MSFHRLHQSTSCRRFYLTDAAPFRQVCYYTNWSQYRNGLGQFLPEHVDPTLCTHLVYAFAGVSNGQIYTTDPHDMDLLVLEIEL